MTHPIRVAMIGLDTSHTIEFARRMQAPDCPAENRVEGLRASSCLRFPSRFQAEAGQDQRQAMLEEWGIPVVTDFDQAVADCDAVMIEINDPSMHLEYFERCATLGKPIFLDKPLADTSANGGRLVEAARDHQAPMFSSSSLRFSPQVIKTCDEIPHPLSATVYGFLGKAAAGSSIVWYGVHAFEMLQRLMGRGARTVQAIRNPAGITAVVHYDDGRRAVAELSAKIWIYGGVALEQEKASSFVVHPGPLYTDLLKQVARFFQGEDAPVALEDTLEVMALLDAADRSSASGRETSLAAPDRVVTSDPGVNLAPL